METSEELNIKAFNNGYLMAKHEPEMLKKITKEPNPQSNYMKSLKLGKQEYEREKMKQVLMGQQHSKDRTNEKER